MEKKKTTTTAKGNVDCRFPFPWTIVAWRSIVGFAFGSFGVLSFLGGGPDEAEDSSVQKTRGSFPIRRWWRGRQQAGPLKRTARTAPPLVLHFVSYDPHDVAGQMETSPQTTTTTTQRQRRRRRQRWGWS